MDVDGGRTSYVHGFLGKHQWFGGTPLSDGDAFGSVGPDASLDVFSQSPPCTELFAAHLCLTVAAFVLLSISLMS